MEGPAQHRREAAGSAAGVGGDGERGRVGADGGRADGGWAGGAAAGGEGGEGPVGGRGVRPDGVCPRAGDDTARMGADDGDRGADSAAALCGDGIWSASGERGGDV